MAPSEATTREMGRRILLARMRLLCRHGFYGLLLMHMKFALGEEYDTAWVSSDTITFNPTWAAALSDVELEFVMEHEVLHAALGHVSRGHEYGDQMLFNVACDIVVNSNILLSNGMDPHSITLTEFGESMHLTPKGDEGYSYTAEEVYEMLAEGYRAKSGRVDTSGEAPLPGDTPYAGGLHRQESQPRAVGGQRPPQVVGGEHDDGRWDWHVHSGDGADDQWPDVWAQRLREACEAMGDRDPSDIPLGVERLLGEVGKPRMDWRLLLNDFVQEEVCDWSFASPDRRFSDGTVILPSYSEATDAIRNVLFMVDASGSVTDEELDAAFSEVKAALDQFDGRMDGWVGFFDVMPYGPTRISCEADLASIRPKGGGGTRLEAAFETVGRHLDGEDISCMVIMTDGCAPFPEESIARGIPVLWLICATEVKPPWGRVARIG